METLIIEKAIIPEIKVSFQPEFIPSRFETMKNSRDAYEMILECWDRDLINIQEQFNVFLFNRAHKLLGIFRAGTGGITGTIADVRIIFSVALKALATSMMAAHNHPSGNLKPSIPDEHLTQKLKDGGKLLDIKLLDHLIITPDGYYSFSDEGML